MGLDVKASIEEVLANYPAAARERLAELLGDERVKDPNLLQELWSEWSEEGLALLLSVWMEVLQEEGPT